MEKLVSFDIKADFGMLKKPDTNDPMYLTFNMLHKPALLGICGAIIGMEGFKKHGELPTYYNHLHNLPVGIQPLEHENGNFRKTIIKYNNGTGFANTDGGNLMVTEQTLIKPSYRCYLLLNTEDRTHADLHNHLKQGEAEYLPYLGKNEFSLWWKNFKEWEFEEFTPTEKLNIDSIFIKEEPLKDGAIKPVFSLDPNQKTKNTFMYFEYLPIAYDQNLLQYQYKPFAFTNFSLKKEYDAGLLYKLKDANSSHVVQLF